MTPPGPRRPFNRTHQLGALIEAPEKLEQDGRLPREVLEALEPGTSMGGARPKVTVEDARKIWLAKLPEKADRHNMQRIEYALALEVGRFGRAASLYNILSQCEAFGLTKEEAQALVEGMLDVVRGWREFFMQHGVEPRSIEMLEQAMLPPSFFRDMPPDAAY